MLVCASSKYDSSTDTGDEADDGVETSGLSSIPGIALLSMGQWWRYVANIKSVYSVYVRLYFQELNIFSYENSVTYCYALRKVTENKISRKTNVLKWVYSSSAPLLNYRTTSRI